MYPRGSQNRDNVFDGILGRSAEAQAILQLLYFVMQFAGGRRERS